MARTLLLLLAFLCLAPPAGAFSVRVVIDGVATRWKSPVLEYHIQYAGSDNLSPEESLATVRKAFEAWRSIDCSAVDFVELGDAPNPYVTVLTGNAPDGVNSLVWIEDEAWTLGKWVLGVTGPIITQDGSLVEADIVFNGYHLTWTTDGKGGTDLESVAVHEIGHMFGMQHNLGPYNWAEPPTLTPNIQPKLKSRTPEWDDQMCACFLYPEGGVWNCESDAECPKILGQTADGQDTYIGAFVCDDADKVCNDPKMWANTSNLGETCEFNSTCADDLFCYPWADSGLCTSTCKMDDSDCPEDFACEPVDEFPLYGVCVPAGGDAFAPGTGPSGCASSLVCQEGDSCLPVPSGEKKLCTNICDLPTNNCPEGAGCWDYGTGKTNGACFDYDLWPGGDPNVAESGPESGEEADIVVNDAATDELPSPADVTPEATGSVEAQVPSTSPTPAADTGCGVTNSSRSKSHGWFVIMALLWGLHRCRERFGLVREIR
jgi:hypothetical protein